MRAGIPDAEIAPARAGASWRAAAERFYDAEAEAKAAPRRHRLFARSYRRVLPRLGLRGNPRLLDAGCGCGELTAALEGEAARPVGSDISRRSLRLAKGFHPRGDFLGADLAALPFKAGSFDAVVGITSVEFCPDRVAVFREFRRVLKPGGRVYLDVRNEAFLLFRLLKPLLPVFVKLRLVEPYPADGFRDWTAREWEEALARAGFRLVSLHASVWPWNFGSPLARAKNLLIELVKLISPVRRHYMVGMLLEKRGD